MGNPYTDALKALGPPNDETFHKELTASVLKTAAETAQRAGLLNTAITVAILTGFMAAIPLIVLLWKAALA